MAKTREHVAWHEFVVGVVSIILFIVLVVAGYNIGTKVARDRLSGSVNESATFGDFVQVLFCYTLSNVAMLSMLAAYMGGLGRRLDITGQRGVQHPETAVRLYAAALVRGFICYLGYIAGLLVVFTDKIMNADQGEYIRLAGLVSVTAFMAGYQPALLGALLEKITRNSIEDE